MRVETRKAVAVSNDASDEPGRWVWPPLILAVTILLILWLGRAPRAGSESAHGAKSPSPSAEATLPWPDLGTFHTKALPSKVELRLPERGMEARLLSFIEDKSKAVDKDTWFDFDRLLFDTGSATLRPESREQLENIAEILKAFPEVEAKIGGYTDNVGDPASNMKLSQDRAANVMKELVGLGIVDERLAAEGYGDAFPVGDNETEEARALNRRISLRVTRK